MTNENKSDFKSYYPHINVTDYLSESGKKMPHDSMVHEHETHSDDEIIVNTSAITFIDINSNSVVVQNTDSYGNGKLGLTKDSMQKLISTLDCE